MAKVAIVGCDNYDTGKVFDAVKRAVDLSGGMEAFVERGTKVLIKPNLISERPPEDAVDTHPEVVRAVIRLVKAAGGIPLVGDSPGGYGANIEKILEISGIGAAAREEGVEVVRFTAARFVDGIPFTRYIFDCASIISVPKLKTHGVTTLTAAIKNMYGTVAGLYKAECHSRAPKEEDFAKVIAKVYSIAKPDLTILDGIVAMEGDGPSAGVPRQMGVVMAGSDGVAIDTCAALLIGVAPLDILVTKESAALGLGEADPARIEITGDGMERFVAEDFKLPQTTIALRLLPHSVARSVAGLIKFKPYIDDKICARCNLCKSTCPVSAITITPGACRIDYKKCIKCLCCQEVCPYKAISIKRNILTKLVWG
ncbi:MAG: DUF362 domain-containing protein [Candidatus Omnitrophica bacterium]|nr:DUF362 domain-containing protein [Candidatus Omnitrophota bacterium]